MDASRHLRATSSLGEDTSCPKSVLAPVEFNGASTYNLCHGWWPCFMIPGSVRSVPTTMFANDQSYINAIKFP